MGNMNKLKFSNKPIGKLRFVLNIIAAALFLLLIVWIVFVAWLYSVNNAKDVAQPFERVLIANGAVKQHEIGHGGHGPSNSTRWYDTEFILNEDKKTAEELIYRVASENGYMLTQASPENRGFLGVGDAHIDRWHFDGTSKKSHYFGHANGNIEVAFALNADPQHQPSEGTTIIRLSVTLPPAGL